MMACSHPLPPPPPGPVDSVECTHHTHPSGPRLLLHRVVHPEFGGKQRQVIHKAVEGRHEQWRPVGLAMTHLVIPW
jgi:hypothetical protein